MFDEDNPELHAAQTLPKKGIIWVIPILFSY